MFSFAFKVDELMPLSLQVCPSHRQHHIAHEQGPKICWQCAMAGIHRWDVCVEKVTTANIYLTWQACFPASVVVPILFKPHLKYQHLLSPAGSVFRSILNVTNTKTQPIPLLSDHLHTSFVRLCPCRTGPHLQCRNNLMCPVAGVANFSHLIDGLFLCSCLPRPPSVNNRLCVRPFTWRTGCSSHCSQDSPDVCRLLHPWLIPQGRLGVEATDDMEILRCTHEGYEAIAMAVVGLDSMFRSGITPPVMDVRWERGRASRSGGWSFGNEEAGVNICWAPVTYPSSSLPTSGDPRGFKMSYQGRPWSWGWIWEGTCCPQAIDMAGTGADAELKLRSKLWGEWRRTITTRGADWCRSGPLCRLLLCPHPSIMARHSSTLPSIPRSKIPLHSYHFTHTFMYISFMDGHPLIHEFEAVIFQV